jgi:hypothetical protein
MRDDKTSLVKVRIGSEPEFNAKTPSSQRPQRRTPPSAIEKEVGFTQFYSDGQAFSAGLGDDYDDN